MLEFNNGVIAERKHAHQCYCRSQLHTHSLTHWTIGAKPGQGGENVDAYTPELYSMRVLRKPLPFIVSPRKRKVSSKYPMDSGSPTKKTKPT